MDEENKQAEGRADADLVAFPTRSHRLETSERGQPGKEGQGKDAHHTTKGEDADGAAPGHSTSITAAEMPTQTPVTPTSPPVSVALPCTPLHDTDRVRPQRSAVAVPEKMAASSHWAPPCPTIAVALADVAVAVAAAAAAAAAGTDLPPSPPPQTQQQQQQQQQQQEEDMRDATAARIDELQRQLGAEVSLRGAAEAENVTLQVQLATAKAEVRAALSKVNELKQKAAEAPRGMADATAVVAATSASVKRLRNQLVHADEETRAEEEENQAVLQQLIAANDESDPEEGDLEDSDQQQQQQQLAVTAPGRRAAEEATASVDAVISELQKWRKVSKWSTSSHLDREPCGRGEMAVKPPSPPREGWRPQGGPENPAESAAAAAAAAQRRAGHLHAVLGPEEVLELQFQLMTAEAALRGLQNELEETKQELEAANVLKEHFYEQLVEAKQRLREKKADVYKLVDVNAGLQRELTALAAASTAAARAEQKCCGSSSSSSIGSGRSSSRCPSGGGSSGRDAMTTSAAAAAAAAAATPTTSLPSLHSMIEAERELLSIRALKAAYQAVLNLQRPHHSEDSSSANRGGEIEVMAGGPPHTGPVDGQRQRRGSYRSVQGEALQTSDLSRAFVAGAPHCGASGSEDGVGQPFDDTLGRSTAPTMPRPRPGGSGASTGISPSGAYFGGVGNSMTRLRNIGNGITARDMEQARPVMAAAAPYASFSVHAYGYGTSRRATITAHFE